MEQVKIIELLTYKLDKLTALIFSKHHAILNLDYNSHQFLTDDGYCPSGWDECYDVLKIHFKLIFSICHIYLSKENPGDTIEFLMGLKALCWDLDNLHHTLYQSFKESLALPQAKHGFLIEDSYLPAGIEECIPIIKAKVDDIAQIYYQIIDCHFKNQPEPERSPMIISYRDEARGGGAFYDHYSLQKSTDRETVVSANVSQSIDDLVSYAKTSSFSIRYGRDLAKAPGKKIPKTFFNYDECGLLIIPGRARDSESKRPTAYKMRNIHEIELIRQARLTGRPILGICAGSWQLIENYGGKIVPVKDHAWSRMPTISTKGKICHNKQIHKVRVCSDSILHGLMGLDVSEKDLVSTNSVHWMAVDKNEMPPELRISATSIEDKKVSPNNRRGNKMIPESCAEAFENKSGAPCIGIQWHPEAYNRSDPNELDSKEHIQLISSLATSGDSYVNKRRVLRELKAKNAVTKLLNKFGCFNHGYDKNNSECAQEHEGALQNNRKLNH